MKWGWGWFAGLLAGPALAMDVAVQVLDAAGKPVADAVVYAPMSGRQSQAAPRAKAVMDQKDREFVPHVLPVQVGTEVSFPNSDNIHHHVYSFAGVKHFELPLYKNGKLPALVFEQPGVVPLGCNIHDWMLGYIYVVDSPYFAKTDARGWATLTGLPKDAREVKVWHQRLMEQEVPMARQAIAPGQPVRFALVLKPERPRKRPPSGATSAY
jgi:plastocyanin